MATTYYSYADMCLLPSFSKAHSRSDPVCSTVIEFGPRAFKVPAVPANMACTMDVNIARWMSANDYFYIMHRFNVDHSHPVNQDNMAFVKLANEENWKTISISLGVQEEDKEFLNKCAKAGLRIDYLTIDIAHAHSIRMKEMLECIHRWLWGGKFQPFTIAGNVATAKACEDLASWGANAVKVGIAQGDACTTYGQTGFGAPMFTCVQECAKTCPTPIIADGGVRMHGDFAKAIVAGAHMVMAGSMFAACKDSPAETVIKQFRTDEVKPKVMIGELGSYVSGEYEEKIVTKVFKRYYGSASEYNKGTKHHVEGRMVELPCSGMTYAEKLTEIEECLQSSISYSGCNLSQAAWGIINR